MKKLLAKIKSILSVFTLTNIKSALSALTLISGAVSIIFGFADVIMLYVSLWKAIPLIIFVSSIILYIFILLYERIK